MELRILERDDAAAFRQAHIRALTDHPEAFGASVIEQEQMTEEQVAEQLAPIPQRFTLGIFEEGDLVAFGSFYQAPRLKMRHRGHIWGMYVAPEARGNRY